MSTPRFAHQTALITGGGGGFGREISLLLASEGAHVAVVDLNEAAARATVDEVRAAGGSAQPYIVDLTDAAAVAALVDDVVAAQGRLDIAVNNAGMGGAMVPMAEYPIDTWQQVLDVNVSSVFYCMRAELAAMVDSGRGGAIINTASIMSTVAMPTISAYVTSKHAVHGLTKAAAVEYGGHGIRVNAVGPSFSRVGFTAATIEQDAQWADMAAQHALGRTAKPRDVAEAVAYLASAESAFITGHLLNVDGGFVIQ